MGEVFLAVAHGVAGFTKLVVLKRARPDLADEPQVLAMFLDEARLAARLNHPNVVQTYEAGEEAGCFFIAMEYLDGQPLHRIRARVGPRWFPLSMQIRILIEALAGLHYAHELADFDGTSLGVIHRDATPQNLFVTYDGQIKVVDFGIAKAASSTIKTRAGMIKGKVAYMAPEQTRSEPLDRRVDIFTVGVMLWEAIAGERMWKGVPNTEIIRRLAAGKLPSLLEAAPQADPELARICSRALASLPVERYVTAAEFQHGLERWLTEKGEDVTARAVGTFVAAHFEKDRAAVKAQLEEELRDYSSSSRPKVRKGDEPSSDPDATLVDSKRPGKRPVPAIAPSAVPDSTSGEGLPPPVSSSMGGREGLPPAAPSAPVGEGAPPPVLGTTAGEGAPPPVLGGAAAERSPVEITVTMRSSLPSSSSLEPPPPVPSSTPSPQEAPASTKALDKGRLSPVPASSPHSERHETLGRTSVSVDTVVEPRSRPRSHRRRWTSVVIGSGVLILGAVAVVAWTTFGVSLAWIDGLPILRLASTSIVDSPVSEDSAPATAPALAPALTPAPAPVSEVEISVRVLPATARIFLDGKLVATGSFKDKLAKDGRVHRIRAEAPNFVPVEESITASSDQVVTLALERKPAGVP
jgi:serine/threonine protein kinase